jgi:hypothetical protein
MLPKKSWKQSAGKINFTADGFSAEFRCRRTIKLLTPEG